MRVVVAGHLCIDLVPALDKQPGLAEGGLYRVGPLAARCGGCVYTTGSALARAGWDVSLAAAVGQDDLGGVLVGLLHRQGLDTAAFTPVAASTSYSIVLQAPGRDRTFWHHTGANDAFDGRRLDLDGVDLLHVGYPSLLPGLCVDDGEPLVELFSRARAAGCTTSLDLAVVDLDEPGRVERWSRLLERVLPHTDVLTPSVDDLTSALGWALAPGTEGLADAAERLLAAGVAVALVTGGTAGLQVATASPERLARTGRLGPSLRDHASIRHREPAVPVERVSGTTGAGDVATAGFLDGLLRGLGPVAAAGRAAAAAARHVAGTDPEPAPPSPPRGER